MDLKKLLSVHMATLAALGTLLLALGQGSVWAPLVVWLAAVLSLALTDFAGWVRLNRNTAAVAALAVMIWFFFRHFAHADAEGRILVLADLLIWLQVILLFQEKDERVYWWLAVMSLLEVVVAAGFSQGIMFGLLLVLYMLTGLSGMTLLFLYSQWRQYGGARASRPHDAAGTAALRPGNRWPLATEGPLFTSSPAGSSRAGVVRELFTRLAGLGAGTLALALVIFFTMPRLGRPAWRGVMIAPRSVVGFSDQVMLGELGPILEDRTEVMQLELTDRATGLLYSTQDGLYLRGTVVTHYEQNQWSRSGGQDVGSREWGVGSGDMQENEGQDTDDNDNTEMTHSPPPTPHVQYPSPFLPPASAQPTVLQTLRVQPMDREELFCLWPFVKPPARSPKIYYDPATEHLKRWPRYRREPIEFTLETTALTDGEQASLTPCENQVNLLALLQLPDLPRLTALAGQWVTEGGLPRHDHVQIARLLERQLAESGQFQYSLQGQARDPRIDAIEDLVTDHPRGHCEYFATALALMLRSQGIPSRVVLGYRCDEWNDVGKFYQVRQLHAHAWVEAYLAPRQLPPQCQAEAANDRWDCGGWLRLDGTPAAEIGTAAAESSAWGRWQSRFHRLQAMWDHYVMEMDRKRQQETVILPLQDMLKKLRNPQWWRETFRKITDDLRWSSWSSTGAWILGVLVPLVAGLLALAAGSWGLWRVARRVWRRWTAGARKATARSRVEFYRRLETLLERRGLVRAPGQTPREFASAAGAQLAGQSGREKLANLPVAVVEAFYQVRFGHQALDQPQEQAVQWALTELDAEVHAKP